MAVGKNDMPERSKSVKRFEQIFHTADLAAKIYGDDLNGLFENAAYAMFSLIGDIEGLKTDHAARVEAEADDTEALLVAWLNELLYQAYSDKALFSGFRVLELGDTRVKAEARGHIIGDDRGKIKKEIKAATYYDIHIEKKSGRYEVTVVFDV